MKSGWRVAVVAVTVGVATGCNQIAGIREGVPLEQDDALACAAVADCAVVEPACRSAVGCEAGRCVFDDALEGTPLPEQTAGDCVELVCDGGGRAMVVARESDAPDDGNVCTLDECVGTAPQHTPQAAVPCYSGPAGTAGQGICKAGMQQCDAAGIPVGGCVGEVVPGLETCVSPQDEDCDGLVNEEGAGCVCVPGATVACYSGPAGTLGAGPCAMGQQSCNADGLGFGPCIGDVVPVAEMCDAGEVDEDCDGMVNEEGAGCVCIPGDLVACYSGPPGTAGVGACSMGQQSCNADGLGFGPCVGDVVPAAEMCDPGRVDEDCDDMVNEGGVGCVCVPGEIVACHSGPPGTAGVGACTMGQQSCDADGLGFGPCVGDVVPAAEMCDAGEVDEDCDGMVNEEGAGCACGDGYVSVGEVCDDGNLDSTDLCTAMCQPAACGDGYLQEGIGETCDDGGTSDGDICSPTCQAQEIFQIAAGYDHNCALLSQGAAKCWGRNDYGQLGLEDTTHRGDGPGEMGDTLAAVDLGNGKAALALAAGSYHTCALLGDGSVKCWGRNDYGQLGLGDTVDRGDGPGEMGDALPAVNLGTGKTALALAASSGHTCAFLNDGTIKCWGYNGYGALGLGDTSHRGDGPGEMGDALPAVDLGTGKTALALAVANSRTCALLNDGSVRCWGFNGHGALGLGDISHRGDGPGEMGDALPAVNLGTGKTALALVAGSGQTCALLDDGSVKCWGSNYYGELGLGDTSHHGDGPDEMGDALPAVNLGTGRTALALAAGQFHTCALLNNGSTKCWGFNFLGQLGLGDNISRGDDPNEMGDALPTVSLGNSQTALTLATGGWHTCAILNDGSAKCWGGNSNGQLGLGNTSPRGYGPGEMGDALPTVKLFSPFW